MCQREIRPQLELYVDLARTTGTREDNASHDSDKYSAILKIHQEKLGRNKSKSPTLIRVTKRHWPLTFTGHLYVGQLLKLRV
jgi:hypothetical protein